MISTNQNDNRTNNNGKQEKLDGLKKEDDQKIVNFSIEDDENNGDDDDEEEEDDEETKINNKEVDEYLVKTESIKNNHQMKSSIKKNENTDVLNWNQVKKLDELLTRSIEIHGRNNMPTLDVTLKDFIRHIHRRLVEQRIKVRDVRINGGLASYILADDHDYPYSDIDIIFSCDLLNFESATTTGDSSNNLFRPINSLCNFMHVESSFSNCCDVIKQTVLDCLLDYMPVNFNKENLTQQCIKESYVKKMAKIYQLNTANTPVGAASPAQAPSPSPNSSNATESSSLPSSFTIESIESLKSSSRWSLISLFNDQGQNIELKFVDKMKRQFQFSVDSFQIQLSSILSYYDCNPNGDAQMEMTENFYPSVLAESMYGNFNEALNHLNSKLIATTSPEEIRGGGLLKYCNLLIRDYKSLYDQTRMQQLEKYMCSRFFIDFSDIKDQEFKLRSYLDSHFYNDPQMCVKYLNKLYQVVNSSTVCLMGHERKQTLGLIESLANSISNNSNDNNNNNVLITCLNDNNNNSNLNNETYSSSSSSSSSTCSNVNNSTNNYNSNNYNHNNTSAINNESNSKHLKVNSKKYYHNYHSSNRSYRSYNNNNYNNNSHNNYNSSNKKYDNSSKQSYISPSNKSKHYKNDNKIINSVSSCSLILFSTPSSISPSPSQSPSPSPSHSSISSISSLYNEDQQTTTNQIALKAQNNNHNNHNHNSTSSSNLTLQQQQPYLVKYYPDTFQTNYEDYDYQQQKTNTLYPYIEIFENCFCPPIIPALNGNNTYYHHPQIYVYTTSSSSSSLNNNNKMYPINTTISSPSSSSSSSSNSSQSTMIQTQNNVYIKN